MPLVPRLAVPPPVPSTNGHGRYSGARTLTAAGDAATGGVSPSGQGSGGRGSRQAWQGEAWGYFDALPESHYVTQFFGSCMSRVKLRLGWRDDAGDISPVYDENGAIDEDCPVNSGLIALASVVLGAFRDPLGGTAALMETIGKNLSQVGELHVLGTDLHDEEGKIIARRWEVLSTDEIKRRPMIRRGADGKPLEPEFERLYPGSNKPAEPIPMTTFVLRIYRRHPRVGYLADAPTRPLLDVMELLVLLVRQLRSTVLSRLAGAGILWIPSEIDFPDDETAPEGSEQVDPFTRMLIRVMTSPITDRGAASAVVPLVARADADLIDSIRHMTFETKDDENAIAKMDALLMRFAQGIDAPVEVVLGHMNTTYANAAQIDEATYKAHIEPLVDLVCAFLTAGYLWPSMGAQRPVDAPMDDPTMIPIADEEVARLVIIGDVSALVTHQNREENALKAMQLKPPLISPRTGLRALGFTDADAPSDEERDEWVRIQQLIAVRTTIKEDEGGAPQDATDPAQQLPTEKPPATPATPAKVPTPA